MTKTIILSEENAETIIFRIVDIIKIQKHMRNIHQWKKLKNEEQKQIYKNNFSDLLSFSFWNIIVDLWCKIVFNDEKMEHFGLYYINWRKVNLKKLFYIIYEIKTIFKLDIKLGKI